MRATVLQALLLTNCLVAAACAADKADNKPAPQPGGFTFEIPKLGESAVPSKFSEAQVAFVQSWIRQLAPECPLEITPVVAESFLEDLAQTHPTKLDRLTFADFPSRTFASTLLRHLGAKLTEAAQAALREKIAERRVAAALEEENLEASRAPTDAAGLLVKIKDSSPVQFRRLIEGRLEDDDLRLLLKKVRRTEAGLAVTAPTKPKVLTAAEIVSEYSRRNQSGAALQQLQAYTVEGRLTSDKGEVQDLLMFRMRPDRFRLVVREGGITRYILAADGDRFWQQLPGQRPQLGSARNMGARRYLAEFLDPLLVGEGYAFERLADGVEDERTFHRIAVRRKDGSKYVARIDAETFREIARENDDQSVARYSDFREAAGMTIAFREEATDPNGRKGVLVVLRITPNPGLIEDFFQPPVGSDPDYFQLEKFWASATPAEGRN